MLLQLAGLLLQTFSIVSNLCTGGQVAPSLLDFLAPLIILYRYSIGFFPLFFVRFFALVCQISSDAVVDLNLSIRRNEDFIYSNNTRSYRRLRVSQDSRLFALSSTHPPLSLLRLLSLLFLPSPHTRLSNIFGYCGRSHFID